MEVEIGNYVLLKPGIIQDWSIGDYRYKMNSRTPYRVSFARGIRNNKVIRLINPNSEFNTSFFRKDIEKTVSKEENPEYFL